MKTKIYLVDQKQIPASFEGTSLFVNNKHILDADETNDYPIQDIADALAEALDGELQTISITTEQLAQSIVKNDPLLANDFKENLKSGEVDYDEWTQGYNNNDIIKLINDL
jgi:hypothetical protein